MDEKNVHTKNDEESISLGGIFDFLLKKWKSIIIVCFIGLAVGVGFTFLPEKIDVDMKNVNEDKVEIFHGYNELLEKKTEERERDLLLSFNPVTTYNGVQSYYIEAPVEDINLIFDNLELMMNDNDLIQEIVSAYDNEITKAGVSSVFEMWHSIENEDTSRIIGSMEDLKKLDKRGVLTISVIGDNVDRCKNLLNITEKYVDLYEKNIKKDFPKYNRRSFMEKMTKSASAIEDRKNTLLKEMEEVVAKVAALKKDLTEDEKTLYYKVLYPEEKEEKSILSYLKMPVLITFMALFIICFIYVMKYIFNHQIKTASELDDKFGLHVIGVFQASKDKKGIDGALQRREYKKDLVGNSMEYISNSLKELNKMPAILSGNKNDETVTKFMVELSSNCSGLSHFGLLQSDPNVISAAHEQKGVILVVHLWNSSSDEVNREIEVASVQDINVLGCVVIR